MSWKTILRVPSFARTTCCSFSPPSQVTARLQRKCIMERRAPMSTLLGKPPSGWHACMRSSCSYSLCRLWPDMQLLHGPHAACRYQASCQPRPRPQAQPPRSLCCIHEARSQPVLLAKRVPQAVHPVAVCMAGTRGMNQAPCRRMLHISACSKAWLLSSQSAALFETLTRLAVCPCAVLLCSALHAPLPTCVHPAPDLHGSLGVLACKGRHMCEGRC